MSQQWPSLCEDIALKNTALLERSNENHVDAKPEAPGCNWVIDGRQELPAAHSSVAYFLGVNDFKVKLPAELGSESLLPKALQLVPGSSTRAKEDGKEILVRALLRM